MDGKPLRIEIDHHTLKLIVGVIALSLASLTSALSHMPLDSISASYHEGGWPRTIFVGSLCAICAFLLAYNGRSTWEMILSKIAAVAAIGVAMFPCSCGGHDEIIPYVHYISAVIMFLVLAGFCFSFRKRAWDKGHSHARFRAFIYGFCGLVILAAIIILAADFFLGGAWSAKVRRLVFYGEAAGLIAFGVAWLTASRTLPLITSRAERVSISPFRDGEGGSAD